MPTIQMDEDVNSDEMLLMTPPEVEEEGEESFDDDVDDVANEQGDDEEVVRSARKKRPTTTAPKKPARSKALEKLQDENEEMVYDWLSNLGSDAPIEVVLKRTWPKMHDGENTHGTLAHYDEPISEEDVQAAFGGGRYQVVVKSRGRDGRYKYAGAKSFAIAGPPKLPDRGDREPQVVVDDGGATNQAMSMAYRLAREAQERADRMEQRSGTDWRAIEHIMAPLRDQVAELTRINADKDARILELLTKPRDNSDRDRLIDIMSNKEDSYANNLQALRTMHEKELSQMRLSHQDDLRRREDRLERDIENARASAQREIDSLKLAHAQALESQKQGYEMRIDGLRDIQKRLEADLGALRAELAELRGRKDQGPLDQIQNLVNLKNGFEALIPSGGDSDNRGMLERVAEVVVNSPIAQGLAQRVAGPAMAAGMEEMAEAQRHQLPPAPEEDMVQVRRKDGRVMTMPASVVARAKARRQAAAEGGEAEAVEAPPDINLDPKAVESAVKFIEAAIRNGTPPETFASAARNMIPLDILQFVKAHGVDAFLDKVAKLQDGSPLSTVQGRTFIRKVARVLLTGSADEPEA